ncbi:hypothetical protein J2T07_000362 [Luteibacter jiangsuensis]|uniref:Uncharacterized protein n=1 Tax=Luteibacter jiangsuensis TaxID=637577 RepID=A0ABT9ST78_9GAMM|nr:hypothetical protein [Luteibacter jiangsuensis]MDQ0008203.1 hypothetical protein [Luteibacter jiangsuensis]
MRFTIFGGAPMKHGIRALCLVASIGCASAQSTISSKAPLASVFDEYSAAAGQGNLSAASELFEKSRDCLLVHRIDSTTTWLQSLSTAQRDSILEGTRLDKSRASKRRAEASRAMCRGSESKVTTSTIYDIALTAARLGDVSASACFMASLWPVSNSDVDRTKAAQYKSSAEYLATHMIEKGDWNFVQAMIIASAPGLRAGYAAYIQSDDAAAQLRYSKLLRLGVEPNSEDAKNLDRSISILSDRLQPEEIGKADEWAHGMFARYYISQPRPTVLSACDA